MFKNSFSRRRFFGASTALVSTALVSRNNLFAQERSAPDFSDATFSMDGRRLRFYSKAISEPVKILQISDSHLYLDDERGEEYREFSGRMAKAYNSTKNFQTGESTNPIEMFKAIADEAPSQKPDAIVLTGDIVSFPTAAGVDYVLEQLEKTGIPFYYVAGNHDWHFEGMLGSERELRDEWIEKRLKPLYPQGVDPLAYSVDVKGIKLLLVDDSIYEILPKQLDFVREELASGAPSAIFMHIPLYAPGRSVGFGVGHPKWNADSDGNYKIERRPQWPKEGHTETTYAFRNELLEAPNLLGAFTGHIHSHSLDICSGKPLSVAPAANDGSTLLVEFLPFKD